jgi:hypothetical protein
VHYVREVLAALLHFRFHALTAVLCITQALALGAKAVFIGRPVLWGLAHSGEEGVCNVLKLLNDELVMAMKLTGAIRVAVSLCLCCVGKVLALFYSVPLNAWAILTS